MQDVTILDVLELPFRTLLQRVDELYTEIYHDSEIFFTDSFEYSTDTDELVHTHGDFVRGLTGEPCTEEMFPSTFNFLRVKLDSCALEDKGEVLRECSIRLIILTDLDIQI